MLVGMFDESDRTLSIVNYNWKSFPTSIVKHSQGCRRWNGGSVSSRSLTVKCLHSNFTRVNSSAWHCGIFRG